MAVVALSLAFTQIAQRSCRLIGLIGPADTISDALAQECVLEANLMVDTWAADRGMIAQIIDDYFPLTTADEYTMGPGGDFDIARPDYIQAAGLIIDLTDEVEIPLGVYDNGDRWARVIAKGITGLPEAIFVRYSNPLLRIRVYPGPSTSATPLYIRFYIPTAVAQFDTSDLSIAYAFPPGYMDAITSLLAKRMLATYPRQVSSELNEMFSKADGLIKDKNIYVPELTCDVALATRRGSDRYYGQWFVPPYLR